MGKYIITLYDKNWGVIREILFKADSLKTAEKKASNMIPKKGEICGAGASTLHTYGLHKFYEQHQQK